MPRRIKTFNPKRGKTLRDNQNRVTPLTMNPVLLGNFKIQEVSPIEQARKLKKTMEKTAEQIKRLIQRRFREPSNAAKLEIQILKREAIYTWQLIRLGLILKTAEQSHKAYATKQENLKKEMQAHIKNLDKIKPRFNPKSGITPDHEGNIAQVFGKQKPELKRVGNEVKLVRRKRFAKT